MRRATVTGVFGLGLSILLLGGCPPGFSDICSGAECGFAADSGGGPDAGGDAKSDVLLISHTDKADLLFVVDNSPTMGDKQVFLAQAIPDLITRLVTPNCVKDDGTSTGSVVNANGTCATGKPEFNPVQDLHIGIVSSSLGSRGGSGCDSTKPGHQDDSGHLLNRTLGGSAVVDPKYTAPSNFLTWLPPDAPANQQGLKKPVAGATSEPNQTQLANDLSALVSGVGQDGCAYEAPLESAYRFLVQPDPYATISLVQQQDGTKASQLNGIDNEILKQRADFLREDSLVTVIMLTDENESSVDPLALGGHGYYYEDAPAVRGGTAACATDPNSSDCFSCFQSGGAGKPECADVLTAQQDDPNVRFFHMKQRFGVDSRFPIERYARGFSEPTVPNRDGEHLNGSFSYTGNANCANPLFAKSLPRSSPSDLANLCNLPRGPRPNGFVTFALIGGVPWQLLTDKPNDLSDTNNGVFKPSLDDGDWSRILGADPLHYNFTGASPRMLESISPRSGLPDPNSTDVHREWDTQFKDLQYACTFPLPAARDCTQVANSNACDCAIINGQESKSPLCDVNPSDNNRKTLQTRGKAYPPVSELAVAKALGTQSIVASICPRTLDNTSNDYGYRPVARSIVDHMKPYLHGDAPDAGP